MKDLNISEEMILLEVWKLKNNAYGVTIRKNISKQTGRIFPYGTLYSILNKLVAWEYLQKTVGEPIAERGGRRKFFYHITAQGMAALKKAMELKKKVWDAATEKELKAHHFNEP